MKLNYIYGDKFKSLEGKNIKYFDTHDYWNIFSFIRQASKYPDQVFKLVTHNSDWPVSKCMHNMGVYEDQIPGNLTWYAQNVDVDHYCIQSIPIGLENPSWHQALDKINRIDQFEQGLRWYDHLCFGHFNTETNPERKPLMSFLKDSEWCHTKDVRNGTDFNEYLQSLGRYMFCICPEGNGIDTHRIWEALYMGCVPIVEDCINVKFYKDLPIYVCSSFYDLEPEDMMVSYQYIAENLERYNMLMLSMDYWKAKICLS